MNSEKKIPKTAKELNVFFAKYRDRALTLLCHNFTAISYEDAEDIFQDAAIALYDNIMSGKLKKLTTSLYSYFMRICTNQTLVKLRKINKTVPLTMESDETNFDDEPLFRQEKADELSQLIEMVDVEQRAIEKQTLEEKVKACVQQMEKPCNQILWGFYWDNLSHKSIAATYGLKDADESKSKALYCRKKFSKYLKENHLL